MHRAIVAVLLFAAPAFSADKMPSWLQELVPGKVPEYSAQVPAVVLFHETKMTVHPDGRVNQSVRKAIKVLTREGRQDAVAEVVYSTDSGKVRKLNAWIAYPSGDVKEFGKKDIMDLSLAEEDVYNESRLQVISKSSAVDPGTIFGYESVLEDHSIFAQFSHLFQDDLPVLVSRFVLELPPGWTVQSFLSNHDDVNPEVNGSSYVWQMENLPPLYDEPARPRLGSLVPRLDLSYFPPPDGPGTIQSFETWHQVAAWLDSMLVSHSKPDTAVTARAQHLVDGASNVWEKLSAIGRFAQDIRYVSIQIGAGRGGGYKPHAAGDVMQKSYGDCKDKVNLMRAMLKAIGIESYPVALYSDNRYYVRADWASPQQFDHVIIAIRVPETIHASAVAEHEILGRLLFFDPTDSNTALGYLPGDEQEGSALIVAPQTDSLIRLPSSLPEANLLNREVKAVISAEGALKARVRERCTGSSASENRSLYRSLAPEDYQKMIERWISRGAPGAQVKTLETGEEDTGGFSVRVDFAAANYARMAGQQLMIFKPAIVSRYRSAEFTDNTRRYPVVLNTNSFVESAEIEVPEGFVVDEMPQPVSVESKFGRYSAEWFFKAGKVYFNRKMMIQNSIVDPKDYQSVKGFFDRMLAAEQASIVLSRQ